MSATSAAPVIISLAERVFEVTAAFFAGKKLPEQGSVGGVGAGNVTPVTPVREEEEEDEEHLGFGGDDEEEEEGDEEEEGGEEEEEGERGGGGGAARGGKAGRVSPRTAAPPADLSAGLTAKMQDVHWISVAKKLASTRGLSLRDFLFNSPIGQDTFKGYEAAIQRWETFLGGRGVAVEHGAWMDESQDSLAGHMVAHIQERTLESQTGACSFLEQLSAACNYFTLMAGKENSNPFNHRLVKNVKKSLVKNSKRARDGKKQAKVLSNIEQRKLISHIVHLQHNRTNYLATLSRLAAALNFSVYLGFRGDNTRSTRLDHLFIQQDPESPFGATLWVFTPFSKTDQSGKGVYRPILRLKNDGFRCPLLSLSMYLLLTRPALEKADSEHPRVYSPCTSCSHALPLRRLTVSTRGCTRGIVHLSGTFFCFLPIPKTRCWPLTRSGIAPPPLVTSKG